MDLGTLITVAREDYLDDVDYGGAYSYRFSDEAITRYLNQAHIEAAIRSKLLFDDSTETVCRVTLVGGTASYSTHSGILQVVRVTLNGAPLEHASEGYLDAEYPGWRTQDSGSPLFFVTTPGRITLYPAPAEAGTLHLSVYRKPLVVLEDETDEPEIPEALHQDLCLWVKYRLLSKPDEDTWRKEEAVQALMEFESIFGRAVPAAVRRHEQESPKVFQMYVGRAYSDHPTQAQADDW